MGQQPLSVPSTESEALGAHIAMKWQEWNNVRNPSLSLWSEIDAYIHATDTSFLEGGDHWDHKTHIPLLSSVYLDLIAIVYATVFPHEDWLGWQGFDRDAVTVSKRKKILSYIKHAHRMNKFGISMRKCIDDLIRYGNCFAQTTYENNTVTDAEGTVVGFAGPCNKRISPYDIVFNPTIYSFEETPKIVRDIQTVGGFKLWTDALQNQVQSLNMEAVQAVLDKRGGSGSANDTSDTYKNQQYVPDGYGTIEQYYEPGQIEVLWFYGSIYYETTQEVHQNRCIAVVDRMWVLFDEFQKYDGIQKGTWTPRPDNLWGQGPLDNLVGLNFMVNHRENAKNDAIDKYIFPDRAYVGDVEEVYDEVTGHTKYLLPEGGSVTDISPDTTVLTFDNQILLHQDIARQSARLPQQLAGFRTPGEKTALEVQSLNDGAFRGFIQKAQQFEEDFVEPLITTEIQVAKENFVSVINVMSEDQQGILTTLQVTEDDLKSNGKLIPFGARRFARQLQQIAGIQELGNSQIGQIIGQHINTYNLAKTVETLYGFGKFDFVEKFAAIEEGLEAQQVQATAEQQLVSDLSQPTLEEMALEDEPVENTELPQQ